MNNDFINTVEFGKALADETRQKIMALCCCKQLSVNDIVAGLDHVSQSTVSHHLSILRRADLVVSERRGKQVLYTLNQEQLAEACCQVADHFAPQYPIQRECFD
jgi:DNA-binding transcriptional ArsR family regulator